MGMGVPVGVGVSGGVGVFVGVGVSGGVGVSVEVGVVSPSKGKISPSDGRGGRVPSGAVAVTGDGVDIPPSAALFSDK